MTHTSDHLALISQEQEYQANSLVELRQTVTGLARDVRRLEQLLQQITNAQQEPGDDGEAYAVTILEDWWTETGQEGQGE